MLDNIVLKSTTCARGFGGAAAVGAATAVGAGAVVAAAAEPAITLAIASKVSGTNNVELAKGVAGVAVMVDATGRMRVTLSTDVLSFFAFVGVEKVRTLM